MDTPYFLIKTEEMDALVGGLLSSLRRYWPMGIAGYSFKTNNLPYIIEYMRDKGLYAEVVSSDEYTLARNLGFPHRRIVFNGPVKGKKEFIDALENGAIVNLDAERELEWLRECSRIAGQIGLRVNFDLETMCPGQSQCGQEDGRFGFSYETGELEKALEYLAYNHLSLSGLHLHCSSRTRSIEIYEAIAKVAVKLVREYQLNLKYIDIGGGFFGGVEGKPEFKDYFSAVKGIVEREPLLYKTNLIVEPGMCLVGAPIDYITKVVDVKSTLHNRFAVVDGSRIHIDPLMRKTGYRWELNGEIPQQTDGKSGKQTVCGFTCMENDRLFQAADIPTLCVGDEITFKRVGAYTMGLAPLFIQWYPAVYAVNKDGTACVRDKWVAKQLL